MPIRNVLYIFLLLGTLLHAQSRAYSLFYNFDASYYNPSAITEAESISGSLFYNQLAASLRNSNNLGMSTTFPFRNFAGNLLYLRSQQSRQESNEIILNFAYRLNLSYNFEHYIGMGLAPIFEIQSFYPANAVIKDPNDPAFANGKTLYFFKANVRLGINYRYKQLKIGFSIPYLLSTQTQANGLGAQAQTFDIKRLYWVFSIGYEWNLGNKMRIGTQLNQRLYERYIFDVMVNFSVDDKVTIGTYYSFVDQIGLLVKAKLIKELDMTYNFTMGFSEYFRQTGGIHEIGLLWKVPSMKLARINTSRLTN